MITDLEKEFGEHNGFKYTTEMFMKKQDNGKWYVKQTISQSYSDDFETWEERTTDFEAQGFNLEKVLADVGVLAALYLESIDYNLFSELDLDEGEYIQ